MVTWGSGWLLGCLPGSVFTRLPVQMVDRVTQSYLEFWVVARVFGLVIRFC